MVFKSVNWVHNTKIRSNGIERKQIYIYYDKIRSNGLKGIDSVHNDNFGQMVLKGVNWVHNDKISSNGLS